MRVWPFAGALPQHASTHACQCDRGLCVMCICIYCTCTLASQVWAAVFRRSGAIFVHQPRCAGSSLEAAIFGLKLYSQHHTLPYLEDLMGADGQSACGESNGESNGYFRFTFVRDPLDRFLSAFQYLASAPTLTVRSPISPLSIHPQHPPSASTLTFHPLLPPSPSTLSFPLIVHPRLPPSKVLAGAAAGGDRSHHFTARHTRVRGVNSPTNPAPKRFTFVQCTAWLAHICAWGHDHARVHVCVRAGSPPGGMAGMPARVLAPFGGTTFVGERTVRYKLR